MTGYRRVSKRRPCTICGKPDWCSTTRTETISFCARSTLNADRVSRYGWGVYYHNEYRSGFDLNFQRTFNCSPTAKKINVSTDLASPSIRDKVYRKLIELSPASSNNEIVNGRGGLLERGVQDVSQYGNLPRLQNERRVLTGRLVDAMAAEGIHSFEGIPGFWRDAYGRLRLWSEHDSFDDLMLIPFVGPDGLIRACQIRFMRYIPNKSGRYIWLSSAKERSGSSAGAHLHHAGRTLLTAKAILVTEGALKAATAKRFLTDRYVVGNSGVATSHQEIIETARRRSLEIAFDNDSFTNPHVARALATLLTLRLADQRSYKYDEEVRILIWDKRFNGIDEALLAGHRLSSLTVGEWINELNPECLEHAKQRLDVKEVNKEAAGRMCKLAPFQSNERYSSTNTAFIDREDQRPH
ncbi:MAG TPA: hypothetical protein PKC65_00325 [Pyrinomonadaceae bacterium]|nr:hypothetical protein [Pyrinomonadaceae bacterium]